MGFRRSFSVNPGAPGIDRYYCHRCHSHGNQPALWAAAARSSDPDCWGLSLRQAATDLCHPVAARFSELGEDDAIPRDRPYRTISTESPHRKRQRVGRRCSEGTSVNPSASYRLSGATVRQFLVTARTSIRSGSVANRAQAPCPSSFLWTGGSHRLAPLHLLDSNLKPCGLVGLLNKLRHKQNYEQQVEEVLHHAKPRMD